MNDNFLQLAKINMNKQKNVTQNFSNPLKIYDK